MQGHLRAVCAAASAWSLAAAASPPRAGDDPPLDDPPASAPVDGRAASQKMVPLWSLLLALWILFFVSVCLALSLIFRPSPAQRVLHYASAPDAEAIRAAAAVLGQLSAADSESGSVAVTEPGERQESEALPREVTVCLSPRSNTDSRDAARRDPLAPRRVRSADSSADPRPPPQGPRGRRRTAVPRRQCSDASEEGWTGGLSRSGSLAAERRMARSAVAGSHPRSLSNLSAAFGQRRFSVGRGAGRPVRGSAFTPLRSPRVGRGAAVRPRSNSGASFGAHMSSTSDLSDEGSV
eukprot:TRINITY_DN11291_c0_g2_i1.p1 TRINITY_DN11291_c0_g2~~TRINITY_DN11291_c0_g2_i1.p1  ORF type:complete len:294 (+),score=79.22 TRINITY_DN11291_c0_g2_i1:249-1130(+)